MKIEVVCHACGHINRNEVPIPSNSEGLVLVCLNCDYRILTFYSDDSDMGKHIAKLFKDFKPQQKVVTN